MYGTGLRNNSLWVIENMQTRAFGSKYDAGDEFRLHIQKDGTVDYFLNEDLLYSSKSHIENKYRLFAIFDSLLLKENNPKFRNYEYFVNILEKKQ